MALMAIFERKLGDAYRSDQCCKTFYELVVGEDLQKAILTITAPLS